MPKRRKGSEEEDETYEIKKKPGGLKRLSKQLSLEEDSPSRKRLRTSKGESDSNLDPLSLRKAQSVDTVKKKAEKL